MNPKKKPRGVLHFPDGRYRWFCRSCGLKGTSTYDLDEAREAYRVHKTTSGHMRNVDRNRRLSREAGRIVKP